MLVDINRIVVGDRIRKDFGDLQELADDISANTLMNPPVVMPNGDGTYTLIAGERRLRAMRDVLGYGQTEVNVVSPRDAEQALNMEISENECRKEFTKTERLNYAMKLNAIETARARERQTSGVNNPEGGRAREKVAKTLGVSDKTIRQEQFIANNRDMISIAEFESWDEGKLSTNHVFKKIKAAQRQAEEAKAQAERERDQAQRELQSSNIEKRAMREQVESLKREVAEKPKPEIVEREVVREVVPSDYDESKRLAESLMRENERLNREYQTIRGEKQELNRKLEQANERLGERDKDNGANRDVEQLINDIYKLLNRHGGKARAFDQFYRVDSATQNECRQALMSLGGLAQGMLQMTEG